MVTCCKINNYFIKRHWRTFSNVFDNVFKTVTNKNDSNFP